MAVKLPGEFGKPADRVSPSRFDLQFLDDFQSLLALPEHSGLGAFGGRNSYVALLG